MSIMSAIFGTKPNNNPPQNPNQQQPGITNNLNTNPEPQQTQQTAQTAPNGVVPKQETQSPAPKFNDLWEPPVQDKTQTEQQPGLTPEKMLEAASKVDFKRVLDAENLAKIKAGGDDAVQALAELLNKTAQTVYGQSTVVAQKLVESEVARAREEFTKMLPGKIKATSAREALLSQNPAFAKPTIAPIVEAVQSQLQTKYPNASTEELNAMAKEFFQNAASDFAPPTKQATGKKGPDDIDWDELLTGSSSH